MKKKLTYLLVALLTLTCFVLPKQNANAQGGMSPYVTISNVTYTSAHVDWSAMKGYVTDFYEGDTCTDFCYTVTLGDRVLAERTTATSLNLP